MSKPRLSDLCLHKSKKTFPGAVANCISVLPVKHCYINQICCSLREIFRVLGLMKTDMVNFTIQSLRPHLMQQAVQYERAKFQQILDKQPGEEGCLNP